MREPSSAVDYDGDGNVTEGMYYEIEGLQHFPAETLAASGEIVDRYPQNPLRI